MDQALYHIFNIFFSFVIAFVLKSILSDYSSFLFISIFFPLFHLQFVCILSSEVSLLGNILTELFIHSTTLCFLVGKFCTSIFIVIITRYNINVQNLPTPITIFKFFSVYFCYSSLFLSSLSLFSCVFSNAKFRFLSLFFLYLL